MSEIINYTRLTTSDRLENKFVTCQAYIPQDRDKAEMGTVFSQIEIESPWFPTSQVGQTIINTLVKEYYRSNDSSDLVNFEESIKKVNESLAHVAQSGETEWIGKLSGVLVLLNNNEIHFSQTGKSQAYLYRGGKINHITEGLESADAPHPLKTFSNLTSGSLQEDDKIIIANSTFFEIINPSELRLIITSLPPTLAAIECAKILQSHGSQDANAIFIELTTIDKLANLSPDQKLEAIYLDQQILTLGRMSKNALKNISACSKESAKKIFTSFSKFSSQKLKPLAEKGIEKSKEHSKKMLEATSKIAKQNKAEKIEEDSAAEYDPILERVKSSSVSNFTKMKNKIRRPLIKVGLYTKEKSKMYLALLIIVLLGLGAIVYFSLTSQKTRADLKAAEAAYQQIVSLSGQADIAASNNNITDAIGKYSQVIALKSSLGDTKYLDQAQTLLDKANSKIEQLTHLKTINSSMSADLNASALIMLEEDLYAFSNSDLYVSKDNGKTFTKTATIGSAAKLMTAADELDLLAIVSNNKLISFNSQGNELKNSTLDLGQVEMITAYGPSLYALDTAGKQLWKLSYEDGGFTKKTAYFKEDTETSILKSVAIDGSVYTLSNNGLVTRYSRGNKNSEFRVVLPDNPSKVEFVYLAASDSADTMVALAKIDDQYRALKIKKTGEIISQFRLSGLTQANSVCIDSSLTTLHVSNGSKVLGYSLN